jgi:hypothetical protein
VVVVVEVFHHIMVVVTTHKEAIQTFHLMDLLVVEVEVVVVIMEMVEEVPQQDSKGPVGVMVKTVEAVGLLVEGATSMKEVEVVEDEVVDLKIEALDN